MKSTIYLIFLGLVFPFAIAYSQMTEKQFNYTSFSEDDIEITEEMLKLTPDEFKSHPEFGKIPYNAPCEDCFELVHQRTDTTKMFVKKGTQGTHFYSQATLGLMHYEKDGYLRTYDPRLRPKENGFFKSDNQDTPTFIDVNGEKTGFVIDHENFEFNNELELTLVKEDGSTTSKGKANWNNFTVGEEGIEIIDAWTGIDINISFELDRIKTNYIIDAPLGYLDGVVQLKFSDNVLLPQGYTMEEGNDSYFDDLGNRYGSYEVLNSQVKPVFKIYKAFGYDRSGLKERTRSFYYELNSTLDLYVPVDWITSDSTVFPITIDPLVTSTATQTAGWMSFRYDGLFCGNTAVCAYNLTVPRPANSTITGTLIDAVYESLSGYCFWSCFMSEAGFKVLSPCGTSPAAANTFWTCNTPNPGTCTGADMNVFPELGSCLGAACSGNVTFQIQNSYCYCSSGGNCGNNCQWMPNNTWSMTLEGRTLETLGNTATGSGSTSIIASSCAGGTTTTLDPDAEYGVPGYSYNWSTGATTPTIDVSNFNTGDIFTADVTDACGNTVTATFEVTCPLAVDLTNFSAENKGGSVLLEWNTESERDNDFFEILRSEDGEEFEKIASIPGAGNSNTSIHYEFLDKDPLKGLSYYRLGIVDVNGKKEYSKIESVKRLSDNSVIELIPNPAKEKVEVIFEFPAQGTYKLVVTDIKGKVVYEEKLNVQKGTQSTDIDTSSLKKGVYSVQVHTENKAHSSKLVIE